MFVVQFQKRSGEGVNVTGISEVNESFVHQLIKLLHV